MARKKTVKPKAKSGAAKRKAATPVARLVCKRPNELIVRMYRQGLGDCFLLAVPTRDGETKYVLIDCGIHARQTKGPDRLLQVLQHLIASTGARLDVVVATHEHADHLSGFVQKDSPFLTNDTTIGELWLAWTEKRGDRQADRLRKKRGTAQKLIDKAVEEARQHMGAAGSTIADHLLELTDFERPAPDSVDFDAAQKIIAALNGSGSFVAAGSHTSAHHDTALAAAKTKRKRASSNELALGVLAAKAGENQTSYCEPGEVREIAGVANLRAYVLGPPRSELLEKDQPSKIRGATEDSPGGAYKEVYLASANGNRALELSPRLALDVSANGGVLPEDWRYPFSSPFRRQCALDLPPGVGEGLCWNDESEPPADTRTFVEETYLSAGSSWRRIDGDWLGAAETLALNLVGDTNNTSLVLAFEWGQPGQGTVLLFPADAQVGNWLSWRDQTYGPRKLTADDLLSRVSIYKVGHHGSHNATVRRDPRESSTTDPIGVPFGLELMNNILAMIPVDWDAAQKEMPDPWKMPHEPLYERLREKAGRRVWRSDQLLTPLDGGRAQHDAVPQSTTWEQVPGMKGARWRRSAEEFETGTKGPLCYDIAIQLA